ncbi:hypothetical protein MMC26_002852 [Xylographa opegraphella]|nr:hypothetical protein [Xylographa opegraphella]
MPKVLTYTPAWLSRPSPGFDLFQGNDRKLSHKASEFGSKKSEQGTRRILAYRRTEYCNEIFVVVGNTIRWANLGQIKDDWEEEAHDRDVIKSIETGNQETKKSYRTLQLSIHEQIHKLIPSPSGDLLAVLTAHTAHIVVLPNPSHLGQADTGPIFPKRFTLGPTTHVLSQSPIASALWHPLGVNGHCIITVTKDAVVRLWELDTHNRSSFDSPALAINLKKLQFGSSAEEDFSPSKLGTNRIFSLDAMDMDVVSACFGGNGLETESGWCPMTLWVAMAEGDIYALCPLLPSRLQPSQSLVPSLTTIVTTHRSFLDREMLRAYNESDLEQAKLFSEEQQQCEDQFEWLAEIDKQDPILATDEADSSNGPFIFNRPSRLGPIPKLQGPFRITPEEIEDELELSDIHVIASRLSTRDYIDADESDDELSELSMGDLSSSVVCLLTRAGRVYVCLDIEGVKAQWLPKRKHSKSTNEHLLRSLHDLLVIEAIDTKQAEEGHVTDWPTFTADVHSNYSFFVSHKRGIVFLSLDPWIGKLEAELRNNGNEVVGTEFRVEILAEIAESYREQILKYNHKEEDGRALYITAPVVLQDSGLGYFLLTIQDDQPQAVILDSPFDQITQDRDYSSGYECEPDLKMLTQGPAKSAYQPPQTLWAESALTRFMDTHVQSRHKKLLKEEIRLSSATLDIMTEAHRVLSEETHQLGIAASDLFRRCERLQEEFRDQIRRANEIASRVERLNDEDADDYSDSDSNSARGSARLERRLLNARERHDHISARHEALRKKLIRAGNRDLSDKERLWVTEMHKMASSILSTGGDDEITSEEQKHDLVDRYNEARGLVEDLVDQAKDASKSSESEGKSIGMFKVPPDIRKEKVGKVMALLERETALVGAVQERLERISLSGN